MLLRIDLNRIVSTVLWLTLAVTGSSCTTPDGNVTPGPDDVTVRKGFISGRALDKTGKPLPNASIVVNNSQFYNQNILGQTDVSGYYSLPLTPGSWYVRGTARTRFDNKTYVLDLRPDTDVAFSGTDGAVRNLSLTVSGVRTGEFGNDGYYGGQIEVFGDYVDTDYFDTEAVELTLKPVGTLLDGSTGQTLVRRPRQMYVNDVPLGKYTITARHRPDNKPMRVRIRNAGQGYRNTVTDSFDPAYSGAEGRYKLNIEVTF